VLEISCDGSARSFDSTGARAGAESPSRPRGCQRSRRHRVTRDDALLTSPEKAHERVNSLHGFWRDTDRLRDSRAAIPCAGDGCCADDGCRDGDDCAPAMVAAPPGRHDGELSWRIRVKTHPAARTRLRANPALDILHAGKRTMALIRLARTRAGLVCEEGGNSRAAERARVREQSYRRAHVGVRGVDAIV
jgi:hypothetical protein